MNTANSAFSSESFEVFYQALGIMGQGMLGIFIFMLIFYLLIIALEKIFTPKS